MSAAGLSQMKSQDVACPNRMVHFSELGEGPPIVLLHGGGPGASGLSNYSRNIEYLARSFRVIVPDMPGYGASAKQVNGRDLFGDLAHSMVALLDALKIPSAGIVGNSLGGACALRMALESPERTGALVLMGPGGVGTTRAMPTTGLKKLLNYYKGEGPTKEKLAVFLRNYLVYDASQLPDSMVEERFEASLDPEVIASPPLQSPKSLGAAIRMDFTRDKRLADCKVPTLVVWGTEDKTNRPSGAQQLQERMPNCDVHLYSKTGHWAQWERAEEFNALTDAFFRKHLSAV